jgi:hypothetical protein
LEFSKKKKITTGPELFTFRASSFIEVYVCKHMIQKSILIISFLFAFVFSKGQDSLNVVKEKKPSKFALAFGLSYSFMGFEGRPYFVDSSGKVGRSEIKNSAGVSVGVGYLIKVSPRVLIRPVVEAHMMPAKIIYDTEINYKTSSQVFPFSVEVPIAVIYNLKKGSNSPTAHIAMRPTYCPETFMEVRPKINPFNFNADLGVGFPFKVKKANMKLEAFYSHGFLEMIGENPNDYKTQSVKHLSRSFAGIRLYFN